MSASKADHRQPRVARRTRQLPALSRRALLRGGASTLLGLPLLECMLNENGEALADGSGLPCRYLNFFCPTALRPSSSKPEEGLTPTQTGFGYDLRFCLQPLAERDVASYVSAVSGLFVSPYFDAPGSYDDDYHGGASPATLTGVKAARYELKGLTADQIVGDYKGDVTPFRSLVYQIDPDRQGRGVSVHHREDGRFAYVEPQTSPTQAFRSLFTNFVPAEPDPDIEFGMRLRHSSLSLVSEQLSALQARLGAADKQRLEEHLTRVRDLEVRLLTQDSADNNFCQVPVFPADDPTDIGSLPDQDTRAELFTDLIQMAVACDLVRSISITGTDHFTEAGMKHELWNHLGGLHADVQHSSQNEELDKANRWFVDKYASMLQKLKEVPEGLGNALDNSAALFTMEGGKAGRAADGGGDANHSTDNMIMLVAGRAGGLEAGQHIVAKDKHPGVVFNSAMRAVGVEQELGEITGYLPELFSA